MRRCMYANVQRKRYPGYFSKFTGKRVNFLKKVFDEYGLYLVFQNLLGNLLIGAPGSFNTCSS